MILVIDDTPGAADAIARVLQQSGREVQTVATVDAAILALAGAQPIAVVLDLVLDAPSAPLHDALARRGIPVLLVSAMDPQKLPEVATARGWRYLAKPFEADALVRAVGECIEHPTGRHSVVPSSITRHADGSTRAVKSTAQVISETVIDAIVALTLSAELLIVRPDSPWVVGGCVVGALLLAGVRVADIVALARGIPTRGGPAAILIAAATAASQIGHRP